MKQPLSLLVAAVAATACAPAVPAGEFRIVGKIENVPDGAVVRLYEPQGQMLRGIGVDTLAGGRFSFRDTVAFPKVVQISVTVGDYRGGTLDVWVAPGKRIEVRGEDKQAWLWEAASDIAEQADEDMYRALVEPQICELNWFQDMLNTAGFCPLYGAVRASVGENRPSYADGSRDAGLVEQTGRMRPSFAVRNRYSSQGRNACALRPDDGRTAAVSDGPAD